MKTKWYQILSIVSVVVLVILTVGLSYATFAYSKVGTVENVIKSGTIVMSYQEATNGISINNAFPMSDETGKRLSSTNETFEFTVSSSITGKTEVLYEVSAKKEDDSTLNNDEIRLYLEKKDSTSSSYVSVFSPSPYLPLEEDTPIGSKEGSMVMDQGVLTSSETNYYLLRMWVAEDVTITDAIRTFSITVDVYGKQEIAS